MQTLPLRTGLREKITRLHCSVESCRPITSFRTTSFRITPRTSRQLLAIAFGSFLRSFRIAVIPCAYEIVPVCRAAPLRGSTPSTNCYSDGVYEESIHALRVKAVSLVHNGRHHLCSMRVPQPGNHLRFFDLTYDPIPVTKGLHCNRRAGLPPATERSNRSPMVLNPCLAGYSHA